jgi:hypothetical protein
MVGELLGDGETKSPPRQKPGGRNSNDGYFLADVSERVKRNVYDLFFLRLC